MIHCDLCMLPTTVSSTDVICNIISTKLHFALLENCIARGASTADSRCHHRVLKTTMDIVFSGNDTAAEATAVEQRL